MSNIRGGRVFPLAENGTWEPKQNGWRISTSKQGDPKPRGRTPDGVEWSPALGGWRVLIGMNEPVDMTLVFGKSAVHKDRYPLQYLSITIVMKKGKPALLPSEPRGRKTYDVTPPCLIGNIPDGFFTRMCEFFEEHFISGFIGVECGAKENNRHLQCFSITHGTILESELVKSIAESIRDALLKPAGLNVCVKVVRKRDKLYVLGYCQKDAGRVTYKCHSFGLTTEEISRAAAYYVGRQMSPGKDRKTVNLSNIFEESYKFYMLKMYPMPPLSLQKTLELMMSTGNYTFYAGFATHKMDLQAANVQWRHCCSPSDPAINTVENIERIIFRTHSRRPLLEGERPDEYDTMTLADIETIAEQRRWAEQGIENVLDDEVEGTVPGEFREDRSALEFDVDPGTHGPFERPAPSPWMAEWLLRKQAGQKRGREPGTGDDDEPIAVDTGEELQTGEDEHDTDTDPGSGTGLRRTVTMDKDTDGEPEA